MGKRGKNQLKGPQNSKKIKLHKKDADFITPDDEIDAFHKKRDIIPLDINADNVDSEDDDEELSVFNYEGLNEDEDDDDEDDDEDDDDDSNLKGLAAKIVRQQKYLREKTGGIEEEEDDDAEEDEKKDKLWSRRKSGYHGGDNVDYELQSSGEDSPAEEEEEVIKLLKERAESLRAEDFGLIDEQDDSDDEPTMEEMMVKGGRPKSKSSSDKEAEVDAVPMYEEVKKDLSALSRDEQMDVVYSSAPELVGLLAELNDASKQLETDVNPLLSKVRKGENAKKEGMHYLEVKQLLLLAYCQAITFYLLLKSEGQPIRSHPVISRLVEIKSLLDKVKELDGLIPDGFEDVLVEKSDIATANKSVGKECGLSSDLILKLNELGSSAEKQEPSKLREVAEPVKMQSVEVNVKKRKMDRHQDQPVSSESVKMLQYRAALEEKLKQKAGFAAPETVNSKKQKLTKLAGKLETTDDFDDDAMDLEVTTRGIRSTSTLSSKLSQIVPGKKKMVKGISGDDDLPERDDLGERRWKHELRVLARAGIESKDDDDDDTQLENKPESFGDHEADAGNNDEDNGSEDDYYNLIKGQREAKLKMKAQMYSRTPEIQFEPEITVDGKRHITTQMEKNRGLTRNRKKQNKNPRTKYKMKHDKAVNRRKGQVRDIRKPNASYGGEVTGINPRISRSTRF